jgi:hypothetical protein
MSLVIKEVSSKREFRRFINLPWEIHKKHKNWLPPVYVDELVFFNAKKNKSFEYCDTILLLAYRDDVPVGRIMGIVNQKYNNLKNEHHGRFGFIECYEDQEIAHELISYIEKWAISKGCDKIIGPYGFSDKDPQGLQIEGFEYPPIISSPCNEVYMVKLIENEGYTKEVDCLVYKYDISSGVPELYPRIVERINRNGKYKLIGFTSKEHLRYYILPIFKLMNETYSHLYGYVPMTEREMTEFADRYMPILDKRFIKVAESDNEVVSFVIAIPCLTEGIQKAKGKLLPFGFLSILNESKRTKKIDLMLGATKTELQGAGLEILTSLQLIESAKEAGIESIEIHLMLETNTKVLAEMERIGAKVHKRFRVYQKNFTSRFVT